jgi:adenosylcobinamide-GDP ribazoletransferase
MIPDEPGPAPGSASAFGDFSKVLRFYSRLPIPVLASENDPHGMPDFSRATWAVPLVGAVIGSCGALVGLLTYLAGVSTYLSATLTIATLVIITGAFHEDGLADSCDGLWGGATRERRLDIMKDSRIGTYGAAGLMLALALRILALAELFRLSGPMALPLVIGVSAFSRPFALIPVLVLPPASGTGLAASVPMPGSRALGVALAIGLGLLALACFPANLLPGLAMTLVALAAVLLVAIRLTRNKIGGHTGDILGACQQLSEITLLIGLSAAANWHGPV